MSVDATSMHTAHIHNSISWRQRKIDEYNRDIITLQNELEARRAKFKAQVEEATRVQNLENRMIQLELELSILKVQNGPRKSPLPHARPRSKKAKKR